MERIRQQFSRLKALLLSYLIATSKAAYLPNLAQCIAANPHSSLAPSRANSTWYSSSREGLQRDTRPMMKIYRVIGLHGATRRLTQRIAIESTYFLPVSFCTAKQTSENAPLKNRTQLVGLLKSLEQTPLLQSTVWQTYLSTFSTDQHRIEGSAKCGSGENMETVSDVWDNCLAGVRLFLHILMRACRMCLCRNSDVGLIIWPRLFGTD